MVLKGDAEMKTLCGTILAAVGFAIGLFAHPGNLQAVQEACKSPMDRVDALIGTEGDGSEYGGMQPYTCVPFGSFHAVPMTRTNEIGRLSNVILERKMKASWRC